MGEQNDNRKITMSLDVPPLAANYIYKYRFGDKTDYFVLLYHRFEPVHLKYLQHCLSRPHESFIMYFDSELTGRDLLSDVISYYLFLNDLGLKKGDVIGIQLQNVPEFVVAQLAALISGLIVVPINVMLKRDELKFVLKDSRAKVLVGHYKEVVNEFLPVHSETDVEHIILCDGLYYLKQEVPNRLKQIFTERKEIESYLHGVKSHFSLQFSSYDKIIKNYISKTTADSRYIDMLLADCQSQTPDDIIEILYTSGTTGPPKGAIYTNYNVLFSAHTFRESWDISDNDVVLALAPLFHNIGQVFYIYSHFYIGFKLVLMYRFDPLDAMRLIEKWKVTTTLAPTTAYIAILNHPQSKNFDLRSLWKATSGGAPTPLDVSLKWKDLTGYPLFNRLGATETTGPITFGRWDIADPHDSESLALSVGKPIPGLDVRICDPDTGKDVNVGEVGELLVRGPNVVQGYHNRIEETKKAFTEDGWYKTGDLVKMDNAGYLYYVDRVKDIINFSGFKIWPREVEDVLYQHPAVKEVAVIGVPDPYHGEIPKAYVVLRDEFKGKVTDKDLIEFVRSKLAVYKSPRLVEFVDDLPKTSTGKISRRLLKDKELERR